MSAERLGERARTTIGGRERHDWRGRHGRHGLVGWYGGGGQGRTDRGLDEASRRHAIVQVTTTSIERKVQGGGVIPTEWDVLLGWDELAEERTHPRKCRVRQNARELQFLAVDVCVLHIQLV